jgi:hypothetical protein
LARRRHEQGQEARARFRELAESRTGDERIREQLMEVLERWFVLGREPPKPDAPPEADAETDGTGKEAEPESEG